LAANVYGRQGYPINWFVNARQPSAAGETRDRITRSVVVVGADSERYPNVYEVDVRAEKVVNIVQNATITLSLDVFNVTNQGTVLQRQNQLGNWSASQGKVVPLASTNTIREIQSPRIFRFGARVAF
jgi:hypothetical protein